MQYVLPSLLAFTISLSFIIGFNFANYFNQQSTSLYEKFLQSQNELPDFAQYTDVKQKKSEFFQFLLPKVQLANERILAERHFVTSISAKSLDGLSSLQQLRLEKLIEKYKVKAEELEQQINQLLIRINQIPASLVLAQAANESAWGTSRFAKQGNNLFGQWCYVKGCGLVPKGREKNQMHEVAKFDSVQDSVESYMRNINSQFSYADLRALRETQVETGGLNGHELAQGLLQYSTRREAYVHEIQIMIKQNNLEQYDQL